MCRYACVCAFVASVWFSLDVNFYTAAWRIFNRPILFIFSASYALPLVSEIRAAAHNGAQ